MNQAKSATEPETQTRQVFSQPDSGSVARLLKQGVFVYLRPYWKAQIVLAITVSLSVLFEIAFPLSLKFLIDSAIVPQDSRQLILILAGIGLLFAISSLGGVVQAYVRARFGSELLKDLRINLFTNLQDLPTRYFDRTQPGEITAFFAKELLTLQFALRDLIIKGFYAVLKLGLIAAALLMLDWRLTLAVAIVLPFTAVLPRWAIKRSAVADYSDKHDDAKIASAVQDNVAAQLLIRAYGLRDLTVAKFAQQLGRGTKNGDIGGYAKFKKGFHSPVFLKSMVVVWTDFQHAIIYGLVIGFGSFLTVRGTLTIGAFSAFIVLLSQVGTAISSLSAFFRDLISAASSLERMERIVNLPPEVTDLKTAVMLPRLSKGIHFDQVSFSYTDQELQLKLNTLSISVGRLTAIVGRSGAGKSTLLKLLMRFYDPIKGRIFLDDYDLKEVNQASLHSQIGVVLQEVILLNGSVRENICLVKPDASDAEVVAAAQAAEIHDTIRALPEGYSTPVGEGGKLLSLGQRQRISLARALLRNPALLLLDEVTSALDPENEAAIIATLRKLARERVVVMVTHRVSTVVDVDEVVVLDEGRVVEQGRHQLLLDHKGLYYRFWQLQTGFIVSSNGRYAEVTGYRLAMIPLFNQFEGVLETLASQFVSEYYEAGHTVFAQGDRGDKFYIIVRGKVSISSMTAENERIELNILLDGDYFGEMALMNGSGLRSATVQTRLPTLFLTLERERFEKMMADFPALQKIVQQTALGRSLKMVNTLGRRKRDFSALRDKME